MATAIVRIQRFNPDVDKKPRLDAFDIEVSPETTVLDALEYIKAHVDGSVTFRRSCRHAICGSCAMNVNGQNMLICNRPIVSMLDRKGRITIRPLPHLPIVKDLVVDRSSFWEQYQRVKPWLIQPEVVPEGEFRMTEAEVAALKSAETCIMCGACYSTCPIIALDKRYIGPHALLKAFLRVLDPRDAGLAERLDMVEQQKGIYGCRTVSTCIDVCPKGLNPTEAISTLRGLALRRKRFEEARRERQEELQTGV